MLRAASLVCFVVGVAISVAVSAVSAVGDLLVLVTVVAGIVCGVVALAKRGPHVAPIIGLVLHGLLVALFVVGFIVGLTEPPPAEWPSTLPAAPTLGPVLLTHEAVFKGEGNVGGASAFLAKHRGQTVVVTARHLLGEGWGIEPPIAAKDVASHVVTWRVHRRQPPDISADVGALVAALDVDGFDVIAFAANDVDAGAAIVDVRDHAADIGEVVFLVGCPYAERGCAQNVYPLLVSQAEDGFRVGALQQQQDVELRGFSGAPVVDKDGVAVGVLVNGGSNFAGFVDITALWKR